MKNPLKYEKKTMSAMIRIYCSSEHGVSKLCESCTEMEVYALQRIDRCYYGAEKPACNNCPIHCFSPKRREQIRLIMRISGPAMLIRHPILTVYHFLKEKRTIEKMKPLKSN
jgi:hypothetical protein